MKSFYLSIDVGASSGRLIVTIKDKNKLEFVEIYRFKNSLYEKEGTLFWNFKFLFENITAGIGIAFKKYPKIKAIGIDTWGVDYGLIDSEGNLLKDPVSYRDSRGRTVEASVFEVINKNKLYQKTGIQHLHFNTIFQLVYDAKYNQALFKKACKMLMMPDLLAYFLTGEKRIEITNLSTTSLYDLKSKTLISELEDLGIPSEIFPEIIYPGEKYGVLKEKIASLLGVPRVPVVAVCSHDTASAILSIPYREKHVYISSGTWSLCGTTLAKPLTNDAAYSSNYTNGIGFNNSIMFLKNIMGLWIVNECKKEWEKEGRNYEFSDLAILASASLPFQSFIDPDDYLFEQPGEMPDKIRLYCKRTGQIVPETVGEIVLCIYQSLAFKYRYTIEKLEEIVKEKFERIVIVGGGTNIDLLNRMTASAANKQVLLGSNEATVLGNALVLMWYSKDTASIEEGKEIIQNFVGRKIYYPVKTEEYERNYRNFKNLIKG